MRAKKWLTFITFGSAVVAIIIAALAGKGSGGMVYDIAMAVLGSALLGFIMSLIEYFVERRNAMEVFWDESCRALDALRKYRYINIDAPVEIVLACFQEEWSNGFRHRMDPTANDDSKDALISWYEEHIPMAWTENDDISTELDKLYAAQMKAYQREFRKSIESCVAVAKLDLGQLGNAYGNLDFMFGNRSLRSDAYTKIYNRIVEFRDLARSELYHFNILLNGEGSFPVCARKAIKICKRVFTEEIVRDNGEETKVVYQTAFDDIDIELEKFRCRMYRHIEPDYPERIPVCGRVLNSAFETDNSEANPENVDIGTETLQQ